MPRGFRIASSFVEVKGEVNRSQIRRQAEQAGRGAGQAYASGFRRSADRGMRSAVRQVNEPLRTQRAAATRAGRQSGDGYASGFRSGADRGMRAAMRDTDRMVRQQQGQMRRHGQRGGAGFVSGVGAGMSGVAAAFAPVGAAAAGAAVLIGGEILRVSKDFEAAMNGVKAVTLATDKQFVQLRNQAKRLGSTTQFSATEAANAMEFLGMAGWDTTQIMKGLPDVLNLAAAGKLDLAEAANIASNIMAGMGMEAEETGRAADALATAATSANVDIQMLGETAKYAAGTASSAGLSVEQLALATGLFGNVGIQGSSAGTALNRIINDLNNSSSKGAALFKSLGIQVKDSSGNMRDFDEILIDLMNSEVESSQIIDAFGRMHGPKLVTVMQQGEKAVKKMASAMDDTSGNAEKMAKIRMEGLSGQLKGAQSAMEGFMIAVGDMGLLTGAAKAVEIFASEVRKLTGWLTENTEAIKPVLKWVGLLVGTFAGVIASALAAKLALAGLAGLFGFLTSPIGLVALAITGLVSGFVYAWKNSERFRDIVTGVWQKVKDSAAVAVGFFKSDIWPSLQEGLDSFKEKAEQVTDFFEGTAWPILKAGWENFREAVRPIVDTLKGFFDDLGGKAGGFSGIWENVVEVVGEKVGQLWDVIRTVMDSVTEIWENHGDQIMTVVGFVWRTIGSLIALSMQNIWVVIQGVWTAISGVISGALQTIKGIIQLMTGIITGDWSRAWEGIKNIVSGIMKAIGSILRGALQIISGIFTNIYNFVTGVFLKLWNWLVGNSLIPDLVNAIIGWFRWLRDKAAALIGMMRDWVVARFRALRNLAVAAVLGLRDRALGLLRKLRDTARGIAAVMRDAVVKRVRALRDRAVSAVTSLRNAATSRFRSLRNQARDIAGTMRNWVVARARSMRDRVVGAVRALRDRVIGAFRRAKDGVASAWGKLKSITKKPVNFVINRVYNDGIRKVWNKVVGAFGGKKLGRAKGLARGGVLPGTSSWRDGDDQMVPMRRGEGVYVSEAMRDPYERARLFAVNRAAMQGKDLRRFRDGGGFALGGIFKGIGDVASGAWDKIKKGASWLKDTFGGAIKSGIKSIIDPLVGLIPGKSGFSGRLKSGVRKMVNRLLGAGEKGDKEAGPNVKYTPSAGVEQWRPVVLKALAAANQSRGLANTTLRRMNQESGGNPRAVNLWDINAKLGHPSAGLMQVIRPTFQAYAGRYRKTGPFMYGVSVNPLANIYASMRYALNRYGSLSRAYNRPGGYDQGGLLQPGTSLVHNGTGKPERVLTDAQWQTLASVARQGMSSIGQVLMVRLDELRSARGVHTAFAEVGSDINRGVADGLLGSLKEVLSAARDVADAVGEALAPRVVAVVKSVADEVARTVTPTTTKRSSPSGAAAKAKATPKTGMGAAIAELQKLVDTGDWKKKNSWLWEDISFQGMSGNFAEHQRKIADGFWAAVQEIQSAVKAGKRVFEDMTFQGMSKTVDRYHDMIAQIWKGNPYYRGFGDWGDFGEYRQYGVYDSGGMLPPGGIALNRSARPERVLTDAQWQALLTAARRDGGTTNYYDITLLVDMEKVRTVADVVEMVQGIQRTSRQYGSRARVGVRGRA